MISNLIDKRMVDSNAAKHVCFEGKKSIQTFWPWAEIYDQIVQQTAASICRSQKLILGEFSDSAAQYPFETLPEKNQTTFILR